MSELAELLAPPTEAAVARALENYARLLAAEYRGRLVGIYLFGSRARGDHRADSDVDLAVVLATLEGGALAEKMRLVDLSFDALIDERVMIQPWPFTVAQWEMHEPGGRFADLLHAARRDALQVKAPS
jgi:predicted nucleotidyltransferase